MRQKETVSPPAETVRRTAVYARQSMDKAESVSMEMQIEECRRFLGENEPVRIYQDKGYSGKNMKRPAFQEMMADIRAGRIKKVVVYKLDRCTRSVLDFYRLIEFFETFGCGFASAKEPNLDTATPTGRAMIGMTAIFAELERETIRQRICDSYYSRIEKDGRWPGGSAPFGFRLKKDSRPAGLEYNKEEMRAVRLIYRHYYGDDTISLLKVARILEKEGCKGRGGHNFRSTSVRNILRNPIYVRADGMLYHYFRSLGVRAVNPQSEWDGSRSAHLICSKQGKKYAPDSAEDCVIYLTNVPGVVESRVYLSVQERLLRNRQFTRADRPGPLGWLSGFLKCEKCGYSVRVYSGKYFSCFGRCVMHECDASFSIKRVTLESVREKAEKELRDHLKKRGRAQERRQAREIRLNEEIRKEEEKIRTLIELAGQVEVPELAGRIREAQERLHALCLRRDFFGEERIGQERGEETADVAAMSEEAKKRLAGECIERILLAEDGTVTVIWKS